MRNSATRQRGVALVNAIFLIVALAALGAYMVSIGGVQQATTNQALINARTLIAARAGLDWAIHRAIAPPTAGTGECSSSTTFGLTGYGLDNIQVTVECVSSLYSPATVYIYQITSTARYGTAGSLDYAERKVDATLCRTASAAPGLNRC